MKAVLPWLLLGLALVQFARVGLPPGNADLISVQSLAFDLSRNEDRFLYPGEGFSQNDAWIAHHERNLEQLGFVHIEPNWCFYPPLVPFLAAPFARMDAQSWRVVWGLIQLVLTVVFAEVILRLLKISGATERPRRVLVYASVVGSYAVARSLQLGQTSLFVAVLLWAGVLAQMSHRKILAALGVGAAIFVKPFLALAEIVPAARRQISSAVMPLIFAVALLVFSLIAVGTRAHVEYWNLLHTLSLSQTAYSGNQSLFAGLLRLFSDMPATDYGFQYDPDLAQVGRFLAVIVIAIAAWAQWKSTHVNVLASTGMWISAALLALPISWEHHLLFLLPALAFLWTLPRTRNGTIALAAATVLLSVCWASFYSEDWTGRLAACLPLLGNLILFVLLVKVHVRSRAVAPAAV